MEFSRIWWACGTCNHARTEKGASNQLLSAKYELLLLLLLLLLLVIILVLGTLNFF